MSWKVGQGICNAPSAITLSAHLDSSRKQMSVVRQTGGKWRPIVEGVLWTALRELQACLERVDFTPEFDNLLFLLREFKWCRY